jgi:LacI family transcriptional regulator
VCTPSNGGAELAASGKRGPKKPTIYDVAKRAGVSTFTVSRVINRSGFVREETRQRVEAAIAELNYIPNVAARRLRTRRSDTVALLISEVTNPFWSSIASSVQEFFSNKRISVILANCRNDPGEMQKQIRLAVSQGVDGIILAPVGGDRKAVERVKGHELPSVVLDRGSELGVDSVRADSIGGAFALTELLLGLGHRRIALVNGPADHPTAIERFEGYANALSEAELDVEEGLISWGSYSVQQGERATKKILALSERPTGIFAANNVLAQGVLNVLNRNEIPVPGEMAVVGFDEVLPLSSFLTVVAQPSTEMGHLAAEMLFERIGGYGGAPREHVLPVEMHVRVSSGDRISVE